MSEKTILVVEDDTLIIEMVKLVLSEKGYSPKFVINGANAVSAAIESSPELIILDLMLPEKSGEEILMELKSQSVLKDIPVIIFTNKSREENEQKLLELGAAIYLVKASTELPTLVSTIDNLLSSEYRTQ